MMFNSPCGFATHNALQFLRAKNFLANKDILSASYMQTLGLSGGVGWGKKEG